MTNAPEQQSSSICNQLAGHPVYFTAIAAGSELLKNFWLPFGWLGSGSPRCKSAADGYDGGSGSANLRPQSLDREP